MSMSTALPRSPAPRCEASMVSSTPWVGGAEQPAASSAAMRTRIMRRHDTPKVQPSDDSRVVLWPAGYAFRRHLVEKPASRRVAADGTDLAPPRAHEEAAPTRPGRRLWRTDPRPRGPRDAIVR